MSIKKKLNILFLASIIVMFSIAYFIENNNNNKNIQIQKHKYISSAKDLFLLFSKSKKQEFEKKLKSLNFDIISDIKNYNIVFSKNLTIGKIQIYKKSNKLYLFLNFLDKNILLYDKSQDNNSEILSLALILLDIVLLIFIYFMVLKLFMPIKTLSNKIDKVANGDLNTKFNINSNDEISDLANSFNKMISKIKSLIEEKEELIRDIGHEIKTPLAKVKFAIENNDMNLIKTSTNQIDYFVEHILTFQMIEKKNFNLKEVEIETVILQTLDMLIINEDDIKLTIENYTIKADIFYMCIALKNLIDNGLKYSITKPIQIDIKDYKIEIISQGEKIDFNKLIKPFEKGKNGNFGIGLSLVDKIISNHNYIFEYKNYNNKNIFCIKFKTNKIDR